jgi:hypothetical protein
MQRERPLDHGTLETIRLMAVERVREGEAAPAVIASYGFNRTTVYKWLAAAAVLNASESQPLSQRGLWPESGMQQLVSFCG